LQDAQHCESRERRDKGFWRVEQQPGERWREQSEQDGQKTDDDSGDIVAFALAAAGDDRVRRPRQAGADGANKGAETSADAGEPRGTIVVEGDRTGTLDIAPGEVPGLIDELPAIAALAAHGGEVCVRGAEELRVKESDRIAALVAGFRSLGIAADERRDGFVVGGRASASGAASDNPADARGDHRMAMAFAIAALAGRAPARIAGAEAVAVSYPSFFETLGQLVA